MDDEQYRHSRHRGTAGQDVSQDDVDRLRFFTQPHPDRPVNGRRRHRDEVGGTDPESSRAMPQRIEPRPAPEERGPVPGANSYLAPPPAQWPAPSAAPDLRGRYVPQVPPPPRPAESTGPVDGAPGVARGLLPTPPPIDTDRNSTPSSGRTDTGDAAPASVAGVAAEPAAVAGDKSGAVSGGAATSADENTDRAPRSTGGDRSARSVRSARSGVRDAGSSDEADRRRRRRRKVIAVVLVAFLAMLGAVGYGAMRFFGGAVSAPDYSGATGVADVIVEIPPNSALSDFGNILTERDVVKSTQAFINAAGGRTMEGGYYKLRTQISASTAVSMMTDSTRVHRVGLMNVPEGLQLESKKGIDGKTTPGIFQMIADATEVEINGAHRGVTVKELQKVAATAKPSELGVPDWARKYVTASEVRGDFRRLEGLIALGTWEYINPEHSATQILSDLITESAARFEKWGLLNDNGSGLTPYETLVTASIVEREAKNPEDFPKVARVILNRLAKDQRLEMDSTSNYKAKVTNIDVHGDAYSDENPWNTYQIFGLPPTPIGAVGERALEATEHPTKGKWLYFVSIDQDGTTLFADDYEEHKRNRQKACDTGLLSTGC